MLEKLLFNRRLENWGQTYKIQFLKMFQNDRESYEEA